MRFPLNHHLLSASLAVTLLAPICFGQEKADPKPDHKEEATQKKEAPAPVCDQQRGILLVEQQVDEAKALHKSPADLLILALAADRLWPWHEKEARALLAEAYDLTDKYFREPFDDIGKWKKTWSQIENPHFAVISVIARRDPEWAAQLAERIRTEENRFSLPSTNDFDPAGRRLGAALALLVVNRPLAIALAQSSLRYPASRSLLSFLFRLAEKDQRQADQLFLEALQANRYGSVETLMYLAPYTFRLNRVACEGDY